MTNIDLIAKALENRKELYAGENKEIAKTLHDVGVIALPCKVGDTIYSTKIDMRFEAVIEQIRIVEKGIAFDWVQYDKSYEEVECWDEGTVYLEDFGKTVFLTLIEAQRALSERK